MKKILLLSFLISAFSVTNSNAQWTACGSGLDGSPTSMIVFNNELYVSNIDVAGGNTVTCLAKWDGTSWTTFGGSGPDVGGIGVMGIYNSHLVVAGPFETIDGDTAHFIAMWNGTSWDSLGSGLNGNAYCMTEFNGDLIVGGNFYMAGGVNAQHIARWNGTAWSAMSAGFDAPVEALKVYNNELYAGGDFHRSVPDTMYYIAKWNGTNWDSLGNDELNGEVYSLEVYNGNLYAGGDFDFDSVNYIGYWNGTNWNGCDNGLDDDVYDMEVFNGELYVGGLFDGLADFTPAPFIARWNGSSWLQCGSGMDDEVDKLAAYNNKLYASGYFVIAGGVSADYIAGWSLPSGISEEYPDGLVSVSPNPANGKITFDLASSLPVTLELFNSLGEKVISQMQIENKSSIDLSKLPSGIYLAEITFKDKQVRKKIVIE